MNEVGKRGSKNKDKIRAVLMKAEIGSWGTGRERGEEKLSPGEGTQARSGSS